MQQNPHLYEINTLLFLRRLSAKYGRPITLSTVPDEEWQELSRLGFDMVWLMGVWQRSPGSRQKALTYPDLLKEYSAALPDWKTEDVVGSPYAVYSYQLDTMLGQPEELARVKARLNSLDMELVLDFVPNHLAFDHPWTREHPDWFVSGTTAHAAAHPDWFFSPHPGTYLAHGRDPNFPPWTDTAQLNYASPEMREALIGELLNIAAVADGVRCDMAMLVLNEIFGKTWCEVTGRLRLKEEFWAQAIRRVRSVKPDFLFLAEVYWNLDDKLQSLGFDFTYDRQFYEKLRYGSAAEIRRELAQDTARQYHMARFIENHDEPRAVSAFGRERAQAAAVIAVTSTGLHLLHDGQMEGKQIRWPVQLALVSAEIPDIEMGRFYEKLLLFGNAPAFHRGIWELLETRPAWDGNDSHRNLLAWLWHYAGKYHLVVVNYSPGHAQCLLKLPVLFPPDMKVIFHDELHDATYLRNPEELNSRGLYIDLEGYHSHLMNIVFM
ncbi:MAG: alpha-amylase family glycosyl hydrolase [Dehalococcoidales bacterium]|nr:alpha-amylase family glycosyl hydrolase [Dehalococcoidales bacterium]